MAAALSATLAQLDRDAAQLLKILDDNDARYPVSPLLVRELHPANVRFISSVENALAEASSLKDTTLREELVALLQEIRYHWIQQVASVRLYIANHSGVFLVSQTLRSSELDDRGAYLRVVDKGVERLQRLNNRGRLNLALAHEAEEMKAARAIFEQKFAQVVGLYTSNQWRADVPFFRGRIKPQFAATWSALNAIEARLGVLASESLSESTDAADQLSLFLWLMVGLAVAFFLSIYLIYERLIRRPVEQVTEALRAMEQGAAFSPLVRTNAEELTVLVQAFRDMQRQVQARESRLASILDNAGEGIITINDLGVVESFNNAAEKIFGFDEEEVIGKNLSLLIPYPPPDNQDDYLRRYVASQDKAQVGSEVVVTGQRKDGNLFPLAIKVTELLLDGRKFFTAIVEDISERKALMDHLRQLAEHDSLTGLYNRQYFLEELERVVDRSVRQGGLDCALLYIDLDNFKFVNDTLGHQAGDRVLVEVAALIGRRSRRGDVIARLGGDEFAVLLFDVDEEQAGAVAENYRERLAEYTFRHEGRLIDVGCSIGIALLAPGVESKEELMSRADIACHSAKRSGRNCVHLYRPDDRQSVEDMSTDMGWARTIKQAIEQDRFDFALQPIVDVRTGAVMKREALLRMLDAEGKIIMPSGFVPPAERFGLISDIDRWVVEHAIDLLRRRGVRDEHFSINLSAKSIGDPNILIHAMRALEESGVEPTQLTFEITETVAIADLTAAIDLMHQLRDIGCRTALDDFGAGYSSFAYLKDLPVDYVKIDGSFVRNIHEDPVHLAMVKSMNEIAHAMGKKTVAEFVTNGRVLAKLAEIGVDYAQGFHLGAPELAGYPHLLGQVNTQLARA